MWGFSLWHQFLCYQSNSRCGFLGSLMSLTAGAEVTAQSGQPRDWQQAVAQLKWQAAQRWTATGKESDGEEVWTLTVYSLWKLLHLPGCLCQTLFSSFTSIFLSGFQKSFSIRSLFSVCTVDKKWSAQLFKVYLFLVRKFSFFSISSSNSYSIYLVSLTSRRGQHFFTKCYCNSSSGIWSSPV